MKIEEIKKNAMEKIKAEGVLEQISCRGRLLFLAVGGSHNFGFPSQNSDYDIRGVYLAPTTAFLGRSRGQEEYKPYEYMSPDRSLDVAVDELGKYVDLVCKSNGNRVEWPNSPLIITASADFQHLKDIVNKCGLSKRLFDHYYHFANDMYAGKTGAKGLKRDLYTLRTYMAGITILEEGKVISDIQRLNEKFRYSLINRLVEQKEKDEHAPTDDQMTGEIDRIIKELDGRLLRAYANSTLPENPHIPELDRFLVEIRKKHI